MVCYNEIMVLYAINKTYYVDTAKGIGRTLGAAALTCSEPRVQEGDQVLKMMNEES